MLDQFLSTIDPQRLMRSWSKLAGHNLSGLALRGGFANEIHCQRRNRETLKRSPDDIDFIVDSFDDIPATLSRNFRFRHIHPSDPPGKTLLQCVDTETLLRIDIFRACGDTMQRTNWFHFMGGPVGVIALEYLAAKSARLALDLAGKVPTPAKYCRDFLRLAEIVDPERVEVAWQDQRSPGSPATFREASSMLRYLISRIQDLLIVPEYSKNLDAPVCLRCAATPAFALADPHVVFSALGYC